MHRPKNERNYSFSFIFKEKNAKHLNIYKIGRFGQN